MPSSETLVFVARIAIGVSSFIIAMVCSIASTVTVHRMVSEVNTHLPERARFSVYGWWPPKYARLFHEYSRLYPDGSRIRHFRWQAAGVALWIPGMYAAIGPNFGLGLVLLVPGWLTLSALFWLLIEAYKASN